MSAALRACFASTCRVSLGVSLAVSVRASLLASGWALLMTAALLAPGRVHAHKASDSYLTLTAEGRSITGRWDIALRDLDLSLGLDANGDGNITWGEVRDHHADIAALATAKLVLTLGSAACPLQVGEQLVAEHTDGAYTVLPLTAQCAAPAPGQTPAPGQMAAPALGVHYTLFADTDPQHRGLLNLTAQGTTRTAVLGPQAAQQTFVLAQANRWRQFVDYLREGVWHIWIGFDHILFLLSLLLPAVGVWAVAGGAAATKGATPAVTPAATPATTGARAALRPEWQPVPRFGLAFWDVLRIVTAFTLAHSITLSLAVLGLVSLPSRLVESAIAASVVLAALNNVWPLVQGRRWWVAFCFGLIHGFGFASVLADLGLPQGALALALVGFNAGVELGQLAIVAAFLPLAYGLRRSWLYRRAVLVGGSLLIAALAAVWLAERVLDLKLLPL